MAGIYKTGWPLLPPNRKNKKKSGKKTENQKRNAGNKQKKVKEGCILVKKNPFIMFV